MKSNAIKKRPQIEGKPVKTNFYLSDTAISALKNIKEYRNFKSYKEVFDLLLTFAEMETIERKDSSILIDSISTDTSYEDSDLRRKSFTINSNTLSGLQTTADSLDIDLDRIINQLATIIHMFINKIEYDKIQPFDSKNEALDAINLVWESIIDLRNRIEKAFPNLIGDASNPNTLNHHFSSIDGSFNDLYFLIKN